MGTHRSRHNKGRKPFYKEHRQVAMHLLAHPAYPGSSGFGSTTENGWYNSRLWWQEKDIFKLDILCEAYADIEGSADALGRPPKSLAWKARDLGMVLPDQWKRLITPKRQRQIRIRERTSPLAYPYISKVRDGHADLLAVNAIIPGSIPEHMRADICQEILLAILEERTTLDALKAKKANATYFIKKFYHDNYEVGGHAISFQDIDEDWDSDAVASSIAAKEWRENQGRHDKGIASTYRTFTPAVQFEMAWQDQVRRTTLKAHEIGQFLSHEEVEEMLDAESDLP